MQSCERCWHNHSYANGIICPCNCHDNYYSGTYTIPDNTGTAVDPTLGHNNNLVIVAHIIN